MYLILNDDRQNKIMLPNFRKRSRLNHWSMKFLLTEGSDVWYLFDNQLLHDLMILQRIQLLKEHTPTKTFDSLPDVKFLRCVIVKYNICRNTHIIEC